MSVFSVFYSTPIYAVPFGVICQLKTGNLTANIQALGDKKCFNLPIVFFFLKTPIVLEHLLLLLFFIIIYLFIFGCVGSSFLCEGFL